MMNHRPRSGIAFLVLVTTVATCAAPPYLSWRLENRGFLGDYTRLTPGREGELAKVHRAEGFAPSAHTRFLVQSPTIWRSDQSPLDGVPRDDLTWVAKEMEDQVRASLKKHFAIVYAPADGVLRVRLALTEPAVAWVVTDTFTTASRGRLSRTFQRTESIGVEAVDFAADARVEVEISDVTTGRVLLVGQSLQVIPGKAAETDPAWSAVTEAMDGIARRLARTIRHHAPPAIEPEPEAATKRRAK